MESNEQEYVSYKHEVAKEAKEGGAGCYPGFYDGKRET